MMEKDSKYGQIFGLRRPIFEAKRRLKDIYLRKGGTT